MPIKKHRSRLEHHLLENMFEHSRFVDLSVKFLHPAFPFTMCFDVHKAVMCQSPFFAELLENMDCIRNSDVDEKKAGSPGVTTLTIDLLRALSVSGFVLAPFQHIVRRKWQKPIHVAAEKSITRLEQHSHILQSHLRFVIRWLYSFDKTALINSISDEDTLRILTVAVLFEIDDLVQTCIHRYSTCQLSIATIMRDLEHICQLPRGHWAYLQLRDATLLLLLRCGPEHAASLALLPVDYMSDVLSADLLFVRSEFDRYILLRQVLMAFMQSVGKITWTTTGPVDQDSKRLSGFVRPISQDLRGRTPKGKKEFERRSNLTGDTVRSRKRKRIPSEELKVDDPASTQQHPKSKPRLSRLSFSACIPFDKLLADASSGGIIDKATVLSYLLKTTVIYSNMTFTQLTTVRQDGIVDEGIVFRALWQREVLKRILLPCHFGLTQLEEKSQEEDEDEDDRSAALDEYFDVDDSEDHERRRRILLGTPRFRFCVSVNISAPSEANGWSSKIVHHPSMAMLPQENVADNTMDDDGEAVRTSTDDEEEEDGSGTEGEDDESGDDNDTEDNEDDEEREEEEEEEEEKPRKETTNDTWVNMLAIGSTRKATETAAKIFRNTFYSPTEEILGTPYRVQIEAQVMPRRMLHMQDDADVDEGPDQDVLVCRFELQRDMAQARGPLRVSMGDRQRTALKPISPLDESQPKLKDNAKRQHNVLTRHPNNSVPITAHPQENPKDTSFSRPLQKTSGKDSDLLTQQQAKFRYAIYCLNRHACLEENDRIDPEDRVMVPVTEQGESERGAPGEIDLSSGYVGQIVIKETLENGMTLDAAVALETFGFQKV